jgi:hypothetical protein
MMAKLAKLFAGSVAAIVWTASGAVAQDAAELAKKLSNPVAAMISVPFQYNYDQNLGLTDDGHKSTLNVQPVVPISLNDDWNLISRTIVPIIWQEDIVPGTEQHGIGDVVQSLFFSPKEPTDGIIWGVGPAFLLPTGTDPLMSAEKWGAGPTAVALTQKDGWTVGALANHIWSFAGDEDRDDVNSTFLQPFVSYTTPDAWTFSLNTESTYDWNAETWSVPVNFQVLKLLTFGSQAVQLGGGAGYWAESPEGGPEGWRFRATMTFLFPTGN